jgi:hypothetical protein
MASQSGILHKNKVYRAFEAGGVESKEAGGVAGAQGAS